MILSLNDISIEWIDYTISVLVYNKFFVAIYSTNSVLLDSGRYKCPNCPKSYTMKCNMLNHKNFDCGKAPRFFCSLSGCEYICRKRANLRRHYLLKHKLDGDSSMKLLPILNKHCKWSVISGSL